MITAVRILVTTFCALLLTSCDFDISFGQIKGNGNVIQKEFNITEDFSTIEAKSGWDVILQKGSQTRVYAEADENLLEILEVYVTGNSLIIRTESTENIGSATSKKVYVTYANELSNISASSGADLEVIDLLEGERLQLDVSSGGSISTELMVRDVQVEVSSGGNIDLSGGAETIEADVSSGGHIDARSLRVEDCIAEASSGGSIKIWAGNSIRASASSGGNISYWGDPSDVNIPSSMTGSVSKKE